MPWNRLPRSSGKRYLAATGRQPFNRDLCRGRHFHQIACTWLGTLADLPIGDRTARYANPFRQLTLCHPRTLARHTHTRRHVHGFSSPPSSLLELNADWPLPPYLPSRATGMSHSGMAACVCVEGPQRRREAPCRLAAVRIHDRPPRLIAGNGHTTATRACKDARGRVTARRVIWQVLRLSRPTVKEKRAFPHRASSAARGLIPASDPASRHPLPEEINTFGFPAARPASAADDRVRHLPHGRPAAPSSAGA